MKVIYSNPDSTIAILSSTGILSVEETARKDVPAGVPYLIVEDSDLPEDWSTSAAWVADFSEPHGYGIGPTRWFIEQAEKEIARLESLERPEMDGELVDYVGLLSEFESRREAAIAAEREKLDRLRAEEVA